MVFSSIPVHLPTVQQKTELWGVIQFLQAFVLVFIGVDNLNVFNFVSKLLDGSEWFKPVSLQKDGEFIAYVRGILNKRGRSTVKLTKVKQSHATDEMVADGTIRWQDKDGNEAADRAADLGRTRLPEQKLNARRRIRNASSFFVPHYL